MSEALTTVLERSRPTKAKVSFGVEVTGKAGKLLALLVDAEGKGTLNVTLEWTRPDGAKSEARDNGDGEPS
jgi:Trypsin-co-occurring domain 1